MIRDRARAALVAVVAAGLSACNMVAPEEPVAVPVVQPVPEPVPPADPDPKAPSQTSKDLAVYYARVQSDLLTQGLLRTDGGGPDTPYTADMVTRNFERIALADEYARGRGLELSDGALGPVKKWQVPVRITAEFGASVPLEQRQRDRASLKAYAARLARVTGHPIAMADSGANFHVLFMGEDDRPGVRGRIEALVPDVDRASLSIIDSLPRSIHCLVIAFADTPGGTAYGKAIALVRSEHPDLLRKSCIHEEVAQGLGLANDSPYARPSIFNDDDEFALLTSHDEVLLKILYDDRLQAGMSADTARPIVKDIVADLMGGTN
ncbi:DUF2927 domain-containing protein [Mesobacterium sp. TK19101]|uniref:DUF2927 domain-containing protein n=1 Tax=Mesobacterium hydrothermale TaxID=3111907 RepID=A0ABU6HGR5_9RHOB|nr:DUF2927 domain-containing protein [Mesobacterium sp. TK19101]MEC3861648.1 DUF2927 domain-containing protein [Mesobacterium sp. TK19101]